MYCQRCGTYNQEGIAYCTGCGWGLAPAKDSHRLLWIVLLILIGLPLLTMLLAFILYVMVMGTG